MKKFLALMCVGALALCVTTGFEAEAKAKKSKRTAKTERISNKAVVDENACDKAVNECQKQEAGCKEAKACDKLDGKPCDKKAMKIGKFDGNKLNKKALNGKKHSELKLKENGCEKKMGDCKKECKGEEHKCEHKSPCCKEGPCKMDGSCGKPQCKPDSKECCK